MEAASRGEKVEFTHKGKKFFIVAEEKPSKLSRLKPMAILPPGITIEDFDLALKTQSQEITAAWDVRNK